jgi:hypothetical protein
MIQLCRYKIIDLQLVAARLALSYPERNKSHGLVRREGRIYFPLRLLPWHESPPTLEKESLNERSRFKGNWEHSVTLPP